jgi:hypothetical protein
MLLTLLRMKTCPPKAYMPLALNTKETHAISAPATLKKKAVPKFARSGLILLGASIVSADRMCSDISRLPNMDRTKREVVRNEKKSGFSMCVNCCASRAREAIAEITSQTLADFVLI